MINLLLLGEETPLCDESGFLIHCSIVYKTEFVVAHKDLGMDVSAMFDIGITRVAQSHNLDGPDDLETLD